MTTCVCACVACVSMPFPYNTPPTSPWYVFAGCLWAKLVETWAGMNLHDINITMRMACIAIIFLRS